jgi:hypothetical protein
MKKSCQHIKSSGARCRAVALNDHLFCFWHARIHRHHEEASSPRHFPTYYSPQNSVENRKQDAEADDAWSCLRANYPISSELPPLEDAESIQIAISLIVRALADARIEHKQAALMLYALQIAANNVRSVRPAIEDSVEHVARNEDGIDIAVNPEPEPAAQPALDAPPKRPLTELQAETQTLSQPLAQAA